MEHPKPTATDLPKWSALLLEAVTNPGLIMKAYSAFHPYSCANQLLALFQIQMRALRPGPLNTFPKWKELSRARDEALIYTDSVPNLRETLSRAADKEMALDAIGENSRDKQQERNDLTNDPHAPHLLPRSEQSLDHDTTHIEATQAEAAELAVDAEEVELAAAALLI